MRNVKSSTFKLVFIALMAAVVFVTTYFIKISIPTPAGYTMLKAGNIFCLLAGMLLGGVYGGLAAGIGSMLYDLTDPAFVASAPFTLVFFFMMAFVCGAVSSVGKKRGRQTLWNIIGAVSGSVTYMVLYFSKSIIVLMLGSSAFLPALEANAVKMVTSLINAVTATVFSCLLAPVLQKALSRFSNAASGKG